MPFYASSCRQLVSNANLLLNSRVMKKELIERLLKFSKCSSKSIAHSSVVLKEKRQKNRRKISVDDDNEKLQFQRKPCLSAIVEYLS
ncbi:RNA polymerase II C-terminal domain phosphatase [Trifolium repens]|nr:RNA polymerase II C-terminal domain phosphatase [Trifolium repens]